MATNRQKKLFFKGLILAMLFAFTLSPLPANAEGRVYPKLANFYLRTPITTAEAYNLAKWDVLILHMIAGQNSAEQINVIRRINPDVIILAYIASEEFPIAMHHQWDSAPNSLFKKELGGISDEMWLRNEKGEHVIFWGTNWMLNVTDYPGVSKHWNDYLSDFVANEILSTGLWDGVFYDNSWYDVSWIQNGAIDANRDGRNDSKTELDTAWRAGMSKLFQMTRAKAKKSIYIVGNGDRGYYGDINGIYFESFTTSPYISWEEKMRLYKLSDDTNLAPQIAIVGNAAADVAKAQNDYKKMRFGLTSALMENGYYAYDAGLSSHAEQWWYDEYSINLGEPMGSATPLTGSGAGYYKDVWRGEFTNGLALVNSLAESREVDLGGEFEKLIGTQDPAVNNGGIVSKVSLGAKDGLLMLKTYQTVKDLVFVNGAFVRFVDYLGNRVRNGFFTYDERYAGGARVYFADIDGAGDEEIVVASGAKLEIFNSLGEHWFSDYPYGGNFKGDIRIAAGQLFEKQAEDQIIIAPSIGGRVIMYNYHGQAMQAGYSPFDPKGYVGGLSVAAAKLDGPGKMGSIIIGTGKGKAGEVLIYDNRLSKLIKRFYPYAKTYKGGVYVAAGDVTGDNKDEIIVSAISGANMPIRVFDGNGKKISEFNIGGIFGTAGAIVGAVDANFDGREDIAVINP